MPTLWSDSNPFHKNSFPRLILPLGSWSFWHAFFWLYEIWNFFLLRKESLLHTTQSTAAAKWQWLCVPVCTGSTSLCQRAPSEQLHLRDPKAAKRNIQAIQTLCAAEEPAFDSAYPCEGLGVAALQKQRYPLQPEWQRWEGAQQDCPSSLQGGTGWRSGGSEALSCHLHVLGKELQAELRAQGQAMALCWHPVVRKEGSARPAQSNR